MNESEEFETLRRMALLKIGVQKQVISADATVNIGFKSVVTIVISIVAFTASVCYWISAIQTQTQHNTEHIVTLYDKVFGIKP